MPEYPAQWVISELRCQRRWWDGHEGDVGVGEAVAADPAGEAVGQCSAAAGPDDEDVALLARDGGKDGAGLAALDDRLDGQVGWGLSPGSFERFSQPLRASSVQTRRR